MTAMAKDSDASASGKGAPSPSKSSNKAAKDAGPAWWADLLTAQLYKRSQGRIVRQVTGWALALVALMAAWRLSIYLQGQMAQSSVLLISCAIGALGLWLSFRVVHLPKFADFLIATEAEMNKVSWPTKQELVRGAAIVLVMIFALTATLLAFDFLWRFLLSALRILPSN